jgi:hypothetical protein
VLKFKRKFRRQRVNGGRQRAVLFYRCKCTDCRTQWPHGIRRRSTATRLLRSWVRNPPGTWMFVCCVFCQVEVDAKSWSLVQRSPTDSGASLCVITKPRVRESHSPRLAAKPEKIKINNCDWLLLCPHYLKNIYLLGEPYKTHEKPLFHGATSLFWTRNYSP